MTPPAVLSVASEVPQSVGVSSSAALEVATARALGAGDDDPLALARLCQEAENHVVGALGSLMAASHAGYDAMGLGHPASTALVHELLAGPGVHGARSSGGGCGGTVVVVCDAGALDDRRDLIR